MMKYDDRMVRIGVAFTSNCTLEEILEELRAEGITPTADEIFRAQQAAHEVMNHRDPEIVTVARCVLTEAGATSEVVIIVLTNPFFNAFQAIELAQKDGWTVPSGIPVETCTRSSRVGKKVLAQEATGEYPIQVQLS